MIVLYYHDIFVISLENSFLYFLAKPLIHQTNVELIVGLLITELIAKLFIFFTFSSFSLQRLIVRSFHLKSGKCNAAIKNKPLD